MRLLRGIFGKVDQLLTGHRPIDEELFNELEELLIQADLSIHTTTKLVDGLRKAAREERLSQSEEIRERLKGFLVDILNPGDDGKLKQPDKRPAVYLFVGVNGVGKTTTIAKLAHRFKRSGHRVLLAAADTFRAAAIDQLEIWADRTGVEIIKHQPGADPGAVVFDTIQAAIAREADVVIVDTAGRLHTKSNLMEELRKIAGIVEKALGREPDETLLVLDATTGQNAVTQARQFMAAVPVSGIALAKMDGTAKGGIVVTIRDELGLPIKIAATGEKLEDMEDFDSQQFVEALFEG
ncbi:MAG: signal recognition particle-docking protein FtsY [Armatimonadetes bacterium RBG_16_58_9]|nr:MAG: signal recognition particle-docking protein FtsY [Armatimonadetes bacterium RBG_16_58_9]